MNEHFSRKPSFVYIGLLDLHAPDIFVKVGKTDHPEKRAQDYATHCPGGLTSMYVAKLGSVGRAFATECRLLQAIQSLPVVTGRRGEWFRVPREGLDDVFSTFVEIAGEPESVPVDRGFAAASWSV